MLVITYVTCIVDFVQKNETFHQTVLFVNTTPTRTGIKIVYFIFVPKCAVVMTDVHLMLLYEIYTLQYL